MRGPAEDGLRVLGVDPGSRITGYGIVERAGSSIQHVDNGALIAPAGLELAGRLRFIHEGLAAVIARYRPKAMSIESVFSAKNTASALVLGHARGVALLAAALADLPIHEYTPGEIKKAVVGRGRADKVQVQEMVRIILGLPQIAQEDASDALAAAICRCQRGTLEAITASLPKRVSRKALAQWARGRTQ